VLRVLRPNLKLDDFSFSKIDVFVVTVEDWIREIRQFKCYHPFVFENNKDTYRICTACCLVCCTVLKAKSYFEGREYKSQAFEMNFSEISLYRALQLHDLHTCPSTVTIVRCNNLQWDRNTALWRKQGMHAIVCV
jgi:hypothetical protein